MELYLTLSMSGKSEKEQCGAFLYIIGRAGRDVSYQNMLLRFVTSTWQILTKANSVQQQFNIQFYALLLLSDCFLSLDHEADR